MSAAGLLPVAGRLLGEGALLRIVRFKRQDTANVRCIAIRCAYDIHREGTRAMTLRIRGCLLALLMLGLAACGQVAQHQTIGPLDVSVPWSRAIPPGAPVAAGFVTIRNRGSVDDRLIEVRSAAADKVEIHEVRDEDGIARMRQLESGLPIPAGETVVLKPGGYHLMFIGPRAGFTASGKVVATLLFEKAGSLDVPFDVRPLGAAEASSDEEHAHH